MRKISFYIILLQMTALSQSFADPIEDLLPGAFKTSPGINVHQKTIAGMDAYEVEEFPEEEKNRNHYDTRGESLEEETPGGEKPTRKKPKIDFLVMHYTVGDFPSVMNLFTENVDTGRVSAHYVITQEEQDRGIKGGLLFQIIPEEKRAWHAGASSWRGVLGLNATSIGIENVNKGFVGKEAEYPEWFAFDDLQIKTLGQLSQRIVQEYEIPPQNVVGHADIAPNRKQDPGILFPWEKLYTEYGVGAWLAETERNPSFIETQYLPKERLPQGISEAFFLNCLRNYGYDCPESAVITPEHTGVVKAFKSHFSRNQHPEAYDATINEEDMLWAWGLEAKYAQK
jgi:N-acetylmuramoyl-L-alanine amidase